MTSIPAGRRRDVTFAVGMAAVLVFALALRWPLLFDGPGYGNRDELMYVPRAVRYGGGDLNPHYFQNPPFMSYLMFGGHLVWYGVGRIAGMFAGTVDFRAQYVADGRPAFVVARLVVLSVAMLGIIQTACLARRLVGPGASETARRVAGWAAALALAASSLHALKSATATNEVLVTVLYVAATQLALRVTDRPDGRAAAAAGAMAGLAAGAKYSGAVVALAVAAACLAAPGMRPAARIRLLLVAGAACVAAFLVVCPWVVLDSAAFRSDLVDLFKAQDRTTEAGGWRRYLATAWGDGLGPVWCVAALVGIASAALGIVRGAAQMRPSRIVALTSIVALCAILLPRNQLAVGRYLLPVYPCCVALACAEVVSLDGRFARWSTWVLAAAASAWACAAVVEVPARWDAMGRTDPRDEMAQWMRRNVPDGAYVITDLYAPWLPRWDARRELEGRGVPPATQERLTPAYRISKAYIYFAGPLVPVADTGIAADDWRRLAKLGSVYVLATSTGRELFAKLPPGEYPGDRWQKLVASSLPLVHSVDAPSRDEPSLYLYAVPPDEPR